MPPKEPKYPCIICKLQVKNNDPKGSICCSVCDRWQHNACCPRLTPAAVEFFESTHKLLGFHYWACDGCTVGYAKLNQRIGNLTTKVDILDKAVAANTASNKTTSDKVEVIEKAVDSIKVARKQDRQDIVKEAKKAWSAEQRERDSRKDNIVLYGLSEAPPNVTSGVERKKADEMEAGNLFKSIRVRVEEEDVKFANRLGTLSDDAVENPRPLRISFRKQQVRENIFANARLLPKTAYKNVSIVPDLTQQQREEDKEMRDEVDKLNKDLTEDEALNWKFRCTGKRGERVITKLRIRRQDLDHQDRRRHQDRTSQFNQTNQTYMQVLASRQRDEAAQPTAAAQTEQEPEKPPTSASEESGSDDQDMDQDNHKKRSRDSSQDTGSDSSRTRTRTKGKKKKNRKSR